MDVSPDIEIENAEKELQEIVAGFEDEMNEIQGKCDALMQSCRIAIENEKIREVEKKIYAKKS